MFFFFSWNLVQGGAGNFFSENCYFCYSYVFKNSESCFGSCSFRGGKGLSGLKFILDPTLPPISLVDFCERPNCGKPDLQQFPPWDPIDPLLGAKPHPPFLTSTSCLGLFRQSQHSKISHKMFQACTQHLLQISVPLSVLWLFPLSLSLFPLTLCL